MNLTVGGAGTLGATRQCAPAHHSHRWSEERQGAEPSADSRRIRAPRHVLWAATWAAGDREDAIEHVHGFIPCQIVAHHQHVTAMGTGQEFRMIDETLLGYNRFGVLMGPSWASV